MSLDIYSYWPLVSSIWLIQIVAQAIAMLEYVWIKSEMIHKIYHKEEMVPVSDRRQTAEEYDDQLIIMRHVEYPYSSKVIQTLMFTANMVLFVCGVHLLATEYFEKWLWSSPFIILFICGCYYIVRYLKFLTGHNHTMLFKEYKEMLKTHDHPLFNIYIENEGSISERIVCRLKTVKDDESSVSIAIQEDESLVAEEGEEIELHETNSEQMNLI